MLNPNRHPPVLRPTLRHGLVNFNFKLADSDPSRSDVLSDDLVIMHLQYSTQWDGLAHVGSMFDANDDGLPEAVYYNGFRAGEHVTGPKRSARCRSQARRQVLSVTSSARRRLVSRTWRAVSVQGRGVMIDLHAHFGAGTKNRRLQPS